jgi:hypothetical protein
MTPFEQFVAREYGRKQGDPIDDIYDEARARWKQTRTMPIDTNARAAQGVFDSLPDNPLVPAPSTQMSQAMSAPPPAQSYAGMFDLAGNQTVFDDLPNTEPLRQSQLAEIEVAQRRNSRETEAQQPKALPDELVQQAWRMFADDHRDFSTRTAGPMKSEPRQALINEYTQGFAQNYAPVLGMTLAEAEAIARNAAKQDRPIQMSDWKGTSESVQGMPDVKTVNDAVNAAKGLREFGREEEAQQLLQSVGVTQPENTFDNAMEIDAENQLLQAAQQGSKRFTMPDGTVLKEDEISKRLEENQNKLAGLQPALAMTPSQPGKVVNINEFIAPHIKNNSILPSSVAKINDDLATMSKEYPNLMVIDSSGMISPASKFKYEIVSDEEQAPPEEKTTEQIDDISEGIGRAVRTRAERAAPIVAPIAQTYLDAYRRAAELVPPVRAKKELEQLQNAAPYLRGALSAIKRGFKGE